MRLLFAVLSIFAACYYGLAHADTTLQIRTTARELESSSQVNPVLEGSIETPIMTGEERAFDTLKRHKQEFMQEVKSVVEKNPVYVKGKEMVDKDIRLKGALLIGRSQLKAVAIVSFFALVGGYIMHLIKD
ncbi:hypothetical protein Plhal304r1_c025g0084161 [Plasmopara halstedii]